MSALRKIYLAFKSGASLSTQAVAELLRKRGHDLSKNRLREFARDSDRGSEITIDELYDLISQWADERRGRIAEAGSVMTGAEIRAARKTLGMTLNEFGAAIGGVSERTLRRWEHEDLPPALGAAAAIRELLAGK